MTTKHEIIEELRYRGEFWANDSYSKEYLSNYLEDSKKAESMSLEELEAMIKARKR